MASGILSKLEVASKILFDMELSPIIMYKQTIINKQHIGDFHFCEVSVDPEIIDGRLPLKTSDSLPL